MADIQAMYLLGGFTVVCLLVVFGITWFMKWR